MYSFEGCTMSFLFLNIFGNVLGSEEVNRYKHIMDVIQFFYRTCVFFKFH